MGGTEGGRTWPSPIRLHNVSAWRRSLKQDCHVRAPLKRQGSRTVARVATGERAVGATSGTAARPVCDAVFGRHLVTSNVDEHPNPFIVSRVGCRKDRVPCSLATSPPASDTSPS